MSNTRRKCQTLPNIKHVKKKNSSNESVSSVITTTMKFEGLFSSLGSPIVVLSKYNPRCREKLSTPDCEFHTNSSCNKLKCQMSAECHNQRYQDEIWHSQTQPTGDVQSFNPLSNGICRDSAIETSISCEEECRVNGRREKRKLGLSNTLPVTTSTRVEGRKTTKRKQDQQLCRSKDAFTDNVHRRRSLGKKNSCSEYLQRLPARGSSQKNNRSAVSNTDFISEVIISFSLLCFFQT